MLVLKAQHRLIAQISLWLACLSCESAGGIKGVDDDDDSDDDEGRVLRVMTADWRCREPRRASTVTRLPPSGALLQCAAALLFDRAESVSRAKANIMISMSCLDDSTARGRLASIGFS